VKNFAKQLDRRALLTSVWAAEFTRTLGGNAQSDALSPVIQRHLAEVAAESADRAVEVLRLLFEVEFRLASGDELNDRFMTWEKFIACCHGGALTDDHGHGELATDDHHISNVRIHPGNALHHSYIRPDWATHVRWYDNR